MDGVLAHEIRDLLSMDPVGDFRPRHGAMWCKGGCLGHPALLPTLGTALGAGDVLHHVAESHLATASGESEGLKPHRANRLPPFPSHARLILQIHLPELLGSTGQSDLADQPQD